MNRYTVAIVMLFVVGMIYRMRYEVSGEEVRSQRERGMRSAQKRYEVGAEDLAGGRGEVLGKRGY